MEITLALDWTPNTHHTGFFVAQAQGIYERLGLQVHLLSPDRDEDSMSAPTRVAGGQVTVGLCPSEGLIAYHVTREGPRLVALATLMQHNAGAIVTRKESGYTCPADLDGCTYATLGTPLECDVLSHMIRHDGGRGDFHPLSLAMLDVPQALFNGKVDAAWIFMGWADVLAEQQGVELNIFRPEDYGVPYSYAQVLVSHPDTLRQYADPMCAFVQGSALGFEYAAHNPVDAARIMIEIAPHPSLTDYEFVLASQLKVAKNYLTREGRWGVMTSAHWASYWDWICEQHLFKNNFGDDVSHKSADISRMFTNQFLL
jgi:ABC-type nitrate/sulfonate/bicarbonate transport system substrate-binding protein